MTGTMTTSSDYSQNIAILIPAYQPDEQLLSYLDQLIGAGFGRIIVVDDGGGEDYAPLFAQVRSHSECTLLTHEKNRGKGAALKTGLSHYLEHLAEHGYIGVITADADGQHTAKDVLATADALRLAGERRTLVLGERSFRSDNVPLRSRFGNEMTHLVFLLFYGLDIHDTQTGLRGIPNGLIPSFLSLSGDRYEYEMNMLMACSSEKIDIASVPIETIYLEENASSHFNPLKDSFRIYRLLLGGFFKFLLSSLGSTAVDLALFQALIRILAPVFSSYIFLSTVIARVVSSVINFLLNKTLVFEHRGRTLSSAVKYYILVIAKMLCSAGLVTLGVKRTPFPALSVKIIVDTVLFFVSYRLQKAAVFNDSEADS